MIWRDIKNFENRYQVSSCGKVRSLDFKDSLGRTRKGRILKLQLDRRGYPRVRLSINNRKFSYRIHRLVATAFIPNTENKPQVNHIDGDKTNNSVKNLEWVTNLENMRHSISTGLYKESLFGDKSPNYKGEIVVLNSDGEIIMKLKGSKQMLDAGFDPRNVNAVVLGKRKTYKGYKFIRI